MKKVIIAICEPVAQLAESVMRARQNGVPASAAMNVANGNPAVMNLVRLAWREPRYHTQEMQDRAVQEFRDKLFMACFDAKG